MQRDACDRVSRYSRMKGDANNDSCMEKIRDQFDFVFQRLFDIDNTFFIKNIFDPNPWVLETGHYLWLGIGLKGKWFGDQKH